MSIQQKLAERIYELLPHKKELEFGCKVKISNSIPIDFRELGMFVNGICTGDRVIDDFGVYVKNDLIRGNPSWFEIIGQPIRLDSIVEVLTLLKASDEQLLGLVKLWQPNKPFENQEDKLYTELGQLILQ